MNDSKLYKKTYYADICCVIVIIILLFLGYWPFAILVAIVEVVFFIIEIRKHKKIRAKLEMGYEE